MQNGEKGPHVAGRVGRAGLAAGEGGGTPCHSSQAAGGRAAGPTSGLTCEAGGGARSGREGGREGHPASWLHINSTLQQTHADAPSSHITVR